MDVIRIKGVKCLEQCLAHRKSYIIVKKIDLK